MVSSFCWDHKWEGWFSIHLFSILRKNLWEIGIDFYLKYFIWIHNWKKHLHLKFSSVGFKLLIQLSNRYGLVHILFFVLPIFMSFMLSWFFYIEVWHIHTVVCVILSIVWFFKCSLLIKFMFFIFFISVNFIHWYFLFLMYYLSLFSVFLPYSQDFTNLFAILNNQPLPLLIFSIVCLFFVIYISFSSLFLSHFILTFCCGCITQCFFLLISIYYRY